MPAGYSKRPLAAKLGMKAGTRICLVDAPDDYLELLAPLPADLTLSTTLRGAKDFIQIFTSSARALERRLPAAKKALEKDGMLWISWPKQSSGVETDLDGNVVRRLGLAIGLVDIKVCAVDETWSGLKFVYRKSDR